MTDETRRIAHHAAEEYGLQARHCLRVSAVTRADRDILDDNAYVYAVKSAHEALTFRDPDGNAGRVRLGDRELPPLRRTAEGPVIIL